jgi:uncharacterized glyoxalase superfamily protein PhnB
MDQRVSLITLGVGDVGAAKAFYERLGWRAALDVGDTVFFQAGGSVLGVWGRDKLERNSAVTDGEGWGGITLAHNVGSPAEVDRLIEQARAAGARIGREPAATAWGGYSGIFIDPDGHPWEVAHNPGFELGADGTVTIPPA